MRMNIWGAGYLLIMSPFCYQSWHVGAIHLWYFWRSSSFCNMIDWLVWPKHHDTWTYHKRPIPPLDGSFAACSCSYFGIVLAWWVLLLKIEDVKWMMLPPFWCGKRKKNNRFFVCQLLLVWFSSGWTSTYKTAGFNSASFIGISVDSTIPLTAGGGDSTKSANREETKLQISSVISLENCTSKVTPPRIQGYTPEIQGYTLKHFNSSKSP